MTAARRQVGSWILTLLFERGCDAAAHRALHHWEEPRALRPLTRDQLCRLRRTQSPLVSLDLRRRLQEA